MHPSQGVAENFIGVLRNEESATARRILRTALLFAFLALVTALAVDLPTGRFFGIGMGIVILSFLVGIGGGALWGTRFTTQRYARSLSTSWNRWMRYSVACDRIEQIHRKVNGKSALRATSGTVVLWSIALFATMVLLLLTVVDGAPAIDKTPVFVAYAAYLGFIEGRTLVLRRWAHGFLVSIDDMVRKGEIALWGVV